MAWVAVATIGGSLIGGIISSDSSRSAANKQVDATNAANATQLQMYNQTREDQTPYRQSGYNALNQLNALMANPSDVSKQPGYEFGLSQGQNAIDRSAASRGGLYSGATLKALQRYGQDYAGTKLNESYNRLANVAGLGQVAVNGANNMNYANQTGANMTALGNALGANALNQGNIWGNVANQVGAYGRQAGWFNPSSGGGGTYTGNTGQEGIDPGVISDFWSSDIRLKTNLRHIGHTERGHNVYTWDWKGGGSGIGVIAQEVKQTDPSTVRADADGFLMVDYSKV